MYTLDLTTGIITRDSDNLQVIPCQSTTDSNFIEYKNWVNDGNEPSTIRSVEVIPNYIPAWEFRDSFTQDELVQIVNAAYDGDVQCRLLLLKIQTATDGVDLNGDSAIDGLTYLNNIGIIANGRINEIRRL
jgi:hypothetical protein